ncbi:MAG: carbohydrate ABC transporter permease [Candidatus Asgardarchaeia archaeon]
MLVVSVIAIVDFPVYWMIRTSIAPLSEIFKENLSLFPHNIDFSNYYKVWFAKDYASQLKFKNYLLNSFATAGVAALISVALGTLAGYSLSRFEYKGKEALAKSVLYMYMFPPTLLVIPLLIFVQKTGLYNTLTSLVIVFCTFGLPFSIWMMRGYLTSVPGELEEAALIDGCTKIKAFIKIIFPLSAPGVGATFIFCFILGWNNFIFPLAFISLEEKKVVSTGLLSMVAGDLTPWGGVMAGAVMIAVPVVIIFVLLQKSFIRGLTAGAIKE